MRRVALVLTMFAIAAFAQDSHQKSVTTRGDQAMGFSHDMTVHHFVLTKNGGRIEAGADSPTDAASRQAIQQHFKHIAKEFSAGNFDLPMFIHDGVPPGVPTMKRLHDQISYRVESTKLGAVVKISTTNPEAQEAVHQFLAFQIKDHQTGDPVTVQ